jgi:hypothetical protein
VLIARYSTLHYEERDMAEEKEKEQGFTVKDKRIFTTEGDAKPETEGTRTEREGKDKAKEKNEKYVGEDMPLPEVNFSTFILSLSSSVLLHCGHIPDPATGKRERNLSLAKQTIDILGLLKDKTKGNLTYDEEQLISNILYDLRLRYVEESKKG